jgi:hypothetical protein
MHYWTPGTIRKLVWEIYVILVLGIMAGDMQEEPISVPGWLMLKKRVSLHSMNVSQGRKSNFQLSVRPSFLTHEHSGLVLHVEISAVSQQCFVR